MDRREYFADSILEPIRMALNEARHTLWTSTPVKVAKDADQKKGTVQLQITTKAMTWDENGNKTESNHPLLLDVPIKYIGGGGKDKNSVILTHPVKEADEGTAHFSRHAIDNWFEKGDVQSPIDMRTFSLSDATYSAQLRSKPRAVKNVSADTAHMRSVSGKITTNWGPEGIQGGIIQHKVVDPNDKATDPFNKATKYYGGWWQPTKGVSQHAVNGKTKHEHSITHSGGHSITTTSAKALSILLHPKTGFLAQIFSMLHSITMTKAGGIVQSAFQGAHKITLGSGGITTQSSAIIKDIASQIQHDGNTNVTGTLGVSQILSAIGGLTTGAFTVVPDSEGGGASTTNGFNVAGGLTTDTLGVLGGAVVTGGLTVDSESVQSLFFSTLPPVYNSDSAAALGGLPVGGVYIKHSAYGDFLSVRQT